MGDNGAERRGMEALWAPWRINYILMEKPQGCFFCHKGGQERDEENLILYRGEGNFALLNSFPYNPGHLMVAPFRHLAGLEELTPRELQEHFELVRRMVCLVEKALGAQGFNIGINLGKVAGAGVLDHLHTHIVPRWEGDTNFMPVLGATKVLPQALQETYERLRAGLLHR